MSENSITTDAAADDATAGRERTGRLANPPIQTMPHIQDTAIVLKRLDYSETSQILVIFTRTNGKIRAIAKGSRRSTKRRFSPGMDLMECGYVVLAIRRIGQEALATISEWKPHKGFTGLRENLDRLNAAQYIVDTVAGLTEDWDPNPSVYDALEEALIALDSGSRELKVLVALQESLLTDTGVMPRLNTCVGCGNNVGRGDTYFSSFEGGLLCRDCESARVEKRLVTISSEGLRTGHFRTDADLAGAFDLFNYHISHLMGRQPAAHRHLLAIANSARRTTR